MPKCTADQMEFGRQGRRWIEADFAGGAISSDGGLMLLRQVDRRIGRQPPLLRHCTIPEILISSRTSCAT